MMAPIIGQTIILLYEFELVLGLFFPLYTAVPTPSFICAQER